MKRIYIAGEWIAGTAAAENIIPSDTREVISKYARANAAHAEAAIAPAEAAHPQPALLVEHAQSPGHDCWKTFQGDRITA